MFLFCYVYVVFVYVLSCLCFDVFMYCYLYLLSCVCFVEFLLCYVSGLLCFCFLMLMFCYVYVCCVSVLLWFFLATGKGIRIGYKPTLSINLGRNKFSLPCVALYCLFCVHSNQLHVFVVFCCALLFCFLFCVHVMCCYAYVLFVSF